MSRDTTDEQASLSHASLSDAYNLQSRRRDSGLRRRPQRPRQRTAKGVAAAHVPRGDKWYRLFFNAQSLATFGGLAWYIARQPSRTIYRARGSAATLLRAGQAAGIAYAVAAASATGISTLAGLDELVVPAAQGPEADHAGELHVRGPFRLTRHPLNLAPLPSFWLTPHMTTRRLAFNVIATLYLVLGSVHEEVRLRSQYGEAYERYRRSGVPFYLPFPRQ
ncbi:MAG TPA: hypothetical protein VF883_09450 [Thermoanaerobaculia bacterium]|jgi:protein-S-isoprenylcysteine O-methyltransferase Ste14